MTDFLNGLLASLFEKFKLREPFFAALLLLVLGGFLFIVEQGVLLNVFNLPPAVNELVKWLVVIYAALTGSRTTSYLDDEERAIREAQYRNTEKLK